LAGLGADVIKVEKTGGDEARINGPFPKDIPTPRKRLYLSLNANKRASPQSGQAQGKEVFKSSSPMRTCLSRITSAAAWTAWARLRRFESNQSKLVMVSITPSADRPI